MNAITLAIVKYTERVLQNVHRSAVKTISLVRTFLGWLSDDLKARIVILADRGFAKTELFNAIEEVESPPSNIPMPLWVQTHA